MNFTVLKNIVAQPMNMFVPELMFLYWEIDIFFTGAVICVLRMGDIVPYWSFYFCTEINISVLGYILLYWCIFYCTGKYTRTHWKKSLNFQVGLYLVFTWISTIIQTWKNCNLSNFGSSSGFNGNQIWKIRKSRLGNQNIQEEQLSTLYLDILQSKLGDTTLQSWVTRVTSLEF